jgi:DNA repair protein RecO (recombination protein O)
MEPAVSAVADAECGSTKAMPQDIEKTEALALRISPFANTSHVVTWLSRDFGRLPTVIKGARRPKSPFLGQYDLFYTCELLFYARERNGLHIARECSPIAVRETFRSDWRAAACASYLCDLVGRAVPDGAIMPRLYELATESMELLSRGCASPTFVFWFELKLAALLGVGPRLSACPGCGADLAGTAHRRSLFSCVRGGILCPECAAAEGPRSPVFDQKLRPGGQAPYENGTGTAHAVHISPDTLAMLKRWQSGHSPRVAARTRCSPQQLLEFSNVLGIFLGYHLDIMPPGRRVAIEMADIRLGKTDGLK